jgi:hypothetical protein
MKGNATPVCPCRTAISQAAFGRAPTRAVGRCRPHPASRAVMMSNADASDHNTAEGVPFTRHTPSKSRGTPTRLGPCLENDGLMRPPRS